MSQSQDDINKTTRQNPASKTRGWLKFITFLIALLIAFLFGGFLTFAQHVDKLTSPQNPPKADGIVVWTGKGGGRLETGARLLQMDKGERLLISGVNKKTTLDTIQNLISIDTTLAQCCIDLDYAATNTLGNARETAVWAASLGYEHIILVTSAYHMPRAQVEISSVDINTSTGRMRITPYPVRRTEDTYWYSNGPRFRRVAQEYGKLLISYTRGRQRNTQPPVLPPIKP
ncbi:MAG: YdcF family protein [Litorimonas sp.]